MVFATAEEKAKWTPEQRIMSSLECGRMTNCGQRLRTLVSVGYGEVGTDTIKKTQRYLRKLQRQNKVYYYDVKRIWVLR